MRAWQPSDMAGVTGTEYLDSTAVDGLAATAEGVTPVTLWTAKRPGGGTATAARAFRDDFRPYLGTINGKQSVYFDTATRQLNLDTGGLPAGRGDKFWFIATKNMETRGGDYYPFGYGGGSGTAVTWKMRQGQVPYSDVGSVGYNVGSAPIATTGISIITETYRQVGTLSRSWYNGQAQPSTYTRERNTSASNARLGHWPTYGNGAHQHLLRLGWGYGEPSADDILRLQGWLSWDTGDNGASLPADHPYKTAAPMVSEGDASPIAGNAAPALANIASTGTAALRIVAAAAITLGTVGAASDARAQITAQTAPALGSIVAEGAGGLRVAGASAASLDAITCAAGGALPLSGTASGSLGAVTATSTAVVPVLAAASFALAPIETASAARTDIRGAAAVTLGDVATATDAGRAPQTAAALSTVLAPIVGEAAGRARIAGGFAASIGAIRSAGLGKAEMWGSVGHGLGAIGIDAAGASVATGTAALVLGAIRSAAQAALRTTGALAGQIGSLALGARASEFNWAPVPASRTIAAPAQVRVAFTTRQVRLLYASKDNRMLIWPTKRVAEVLDYALDWSARIGDEAIVSSKAVVRGDMVTIDRDRHDGKVQQVWLAGGVNGVGHVIMQVTTDAGRVYEEAVQLSVAV